MMEKKKGNLLTVLCLSLLMFTAVGLDAFAGENIIVSAAASLTEAMKEVGNAFQKEHPEIAVTFNFASSGALLRQIQHGAPADVFASANQLYMDEAEKKGLIVRKSRRDFVRNRLVVAIPSASQTVLSKPEDLLSPGIQRIAVGQPDSVPAGRYAMESLRKAELWEGLKDKFIYANTVKQALDYIAREEVDAGFVYSTDAAVGGNRVKVAFEMEGHKPIVYPAAVVTASEKKVAAGKFADFIFSEKAQAIFLDFGFKKAK